MSKRKRQSRLAAGQFKRHQLEGFERQHVLGSFAAYDWEQIAPHRWQRTGGFRLVEDVANVIGDGKEATIYSCRADPALGCEYCVAKIYRASNFRAFSNTADYIDDGGFRDRRMAKAVRQRTRRGKQISHDEWVTREWATLTNLYDAGVPVPIPYARSSDGILMQLVGHGEEAAPLLQWADLDNETAEKIFETILKAIATMLALDTVHGDLSSYNVLVHQDEPVIIDMPQAIDAAGHPDAERMLRRDIANIGRFFRKRGLTFDDHAFADELWEKWRRGKL